LEGEQVLGGVPLAVVVGGMTLMVVVIVMVMMMFPHRRMSNLLHPYL